MKYLLILLLIGCGAARPAPKDPLAVTSALELELRALAYERAGDAIRAEQYLVAAIAQGLPEDRAIDALLRICVASSRYGAALRHAERYRARHDTFEAGFMVASLEAAVGNEDAAVAELRRLVRRWPAEAAPRYALATLLDGAGEARAAATQYRAYLKLAPEGEHARPARVRLAELRRERRRARRR